MRTVQPEKAAHRGRRRWRSGALVPAVATALLAGGFAGLAGLTVPGVAVAAAAAAHGSATAAGATTLTTTIGGHQRTAIVHVPSGYAGSQKVPLAVARSASACRAARLR